MTYTPKRPPRVRQREALEVSRGRKFFALRMRMRTGKSKVILDQFGEMQDEGRVDDLLVIAPAGAYRTWETAIEEDVGEPLASTLRVFTWSAQDGDTLAQRRRVAAFLGYEGPRALLVNVEALSTVKRAQELVLQFARQRRVFGVVDESTTIKNPTSKRTKFLLRRVRDLLAVRRILTGQLTPRSPLDSWAQFEFLEPGVLGYSTFWSFRSRYAILKPIMVGGRRVEVIDTEKGQRGYRDVEDLAQRMAPHSYRCTLEDCYDVPDKQFAIREVQLTDEQRRVYNELRDYATAKLSAEAHVTATQVMVQIMRLHQVLCGHTVDELGHVHEIAENRTAELLRLLEENDDGKSKAIIWCAYDHDVRKVSAAIEREYGPGSVARFWGGNKSTREAEERRFKTDPVCRFEVATAAAGGRGRTWDVADLVVYYANTNDLEHREQSEERPQNVGKMTPVLYVDFVVRGTVDENYLRSLRDKIDMAAVINRDTWREWVI